MEINNTNNNQIYTNKIEQFTNKRCIVTGGLGFIGSHLVDKLIGLGNKVIVIDDLSTGKLENLSHTKNFELINGTLNNIALLKDTIKEGDYIFHLAAIPSVPKSVKDPITSMSSGSDATLNLLYYAKENKAKRIILSSSSSVYGDTEQLPKHENMCKKPLSPYAITKSTNEDFARVFYEIYGLETISLRYFNVFGPRQDPKSEYSAVIPKFIFALLNNKKPVIYGDGKQSRDFTYVENVVNANILAAMANENALGKTINVASGIRINLLQLVELLNNLLGKNIKPEFSDPRKGDIKHSYADISLAKELLGYSVSVSFEEGLRRTVDFFKNH